MIFKCEHCGKEFDSLMEAQKCETKCIEAEEAKSKAAQEAEIEFKDDVEFLTDLYEIACRDEENYLSTKEEYEKALKEFCGKYNNISIKTTKTEDGDPTLSIKKTEGGKSYDGFKDIFDEPDTLFTSRLGSFPKFKHFWF